ncbi:hypothetical protein J6590_054428 [Homalodisca vitripennis]|nr:hypothetical protein J6590_054428 [Homalodisca vitripennis]
MRVEVSLAPRIQRPPGLGVRHCQAILTFFCQVLMFSMRVNLSVAIVAMTDPSSSRLGLEVLPWDNSQKGIILSSVFWGYILLQIPAGHLARRVGPKYVLLGAMTVCSVFTLLGPYIAQNFNWITFCFSRVVQGLAQGFLMPSINVHMSKWAPETERNRIFSFVFVGSVVGTMVTLTVAGYLAASPWGWPSIFYVTGISGLLWCLSWLLIGADTPDSHPTISDSERDFIKSTLTFTSDQSNKMSTPWKSILTSTPVWALVTMHLCHNWGYWTLATMLPIYFHHVLGFDIKSNGLISSLPYMIKFFLTLIFSWTADYISQKRLLPLNTNRKMWNSIAYWGGAAGLAGLPLVFSAPAASALLTLSVSLGAGMFSGFMTNHLDLSPNFAGLLMGITNGLAALSSLLAPMTAGFIVTDERSRDQWMIVFYISSVIFFIGNSVFVLFGSTEVQPWNNLYKHKLNYNFNDEDHTEQSERIKSP